MEGSLRERNKAAGPWEEKELPGEGCLREGLWVKIWGSRGSCPSPFADRMAYGGNTSCVSVQWENGLAVFDGGTGLLALGQWLEEGCRRGKIDPDLEIHLFIGHLHLDHILGLVLFSRMFKEGSSIHLYGPGREGESFRKRLAAVLSPPYWPVAIDRLPASITWHDADKEGEWNLPGQVKVRAMESDHPDGCFLYRLDRGGQSVVYGMDCELGGEEAKERGAGGEEKEAKEKGTGAKRTESGGEIKERYKVFAKDCRLLLFDAPYTGKEYPLYRGFGHSFWEMGLELAGECGAGDVWICHHNWDRTDPELDQIGHQLHRQAKAMGLSARIAKEGDSKELL